jgi:hypothetical protein
LLKEILQTARYENKNFILVFKTHILGQLFYRGKLWFKRIFFLNKALSKPYLVRSGILTAHTWKKELDTIDYFPNDSYYLTCSSKKIRTIVFNRSSPPTGLIWYKLTHENAMISLDPTRDERLVEFAFSIPESLYYSGGKRKYLYKIWMKNFIPSSILNARSKSLQSADIAKRFISNNNYMSRVQEIINKTDSNNFVDYKRLYYLIDSFSDTKTTIFTKRGILAELFSIFSMISFVKNNEISQMKKKI